MSGEIDRAFLLEPSPTGTGRNGSMEVSLASCENYKTCSARWEADEFFVGPDGTFYDYKYSFENEEEEK